MGRSGGGGGGGFSGGGFGGGPRPGRGRGDGRWGAPPPHRPHFGGWGWGWPYFGGWGWGWPYFGGWGWGWRRYGGGFWLGLLLGRASASDDGTRARDDAEGARSGCAGCLAWLGRAIAVLVVIAILWYLLVAAIGAGTRTTTSTTTTTREALSGVVNETAYYTDADGDWVHDPSDLEDGLAYFYQRTGVQPYVYILENGTTTSTTELTSMAGVLYDELFTDRGHFLLVFCDDGNGGFNCGYWIGSDAESIMDSEALAILQTELDHAYDHAQTDEEVFSDAFRQTADQIMGTSSPSGNLVAGVALVVIVAGGAALLLKRHRDRAEAEKKQQADKILNTPPQNFGNKESQ